VAFVPSIGAWPDLRRAFDEGIKSALLDGRDVRETLAAIEREWDRILDAEIPATLDTVPRPEPAPQTTPNHGGEVVP
jgi:putative chitobiose transport system substrate-binding protein